MVSKESIYFKMKSLFNGESYPNHEHTISYNYFIKNMKILLKKHKAIHLTPMSDETQFMRDSFDEKLFADNLIDGNLSKYHYIGGSAPRKKIKVPQGSDIVFTANEAPNTAIIPFHHELTQSDNPPDYLAFYCKNKAEKGGETPLMDSNLAYRYIHENFPSIEMKMNKLGVRYTRILPEQDDLSSPLGRSWKNTYNVDSRSCLENILDLKDGIDYHWKSDGCISITSEILPAIFYNHETNNYIFFNSIVAAYNGWQDDRNDRFKSVTYGNGEPIESDFLVSLTEYINKNSVSWKWNNGDIIWIDNRQAMHSRNPYIGKRQVYASLWGRSNRETHSPKMTGILNNNYHYLPITFGLWKLKNVEESVYNAIKTGYRRLDSACDYGNEKEVGKGIEKAMKDNLCKREDLHITSKLWNTYHHHDHVEEACMKTLNDLNLDYLDLYLIHFPISLEYVSIDDKYPPEWTNNEGEMVLVKQDLLQTWKALEKLYKKNLVKQIGVSNYNSALLRQLVNTAEIPPQAIQIELHPYLSQKNMIKLSKSYDLEISGFSPLGAKSYVELEMADIHQDLVHHDLIQHLSCYYTKSATQILLRWGIDRGTIPICKSSSLSHMKENINIFDFSISEIDMNRLDKLNINLRFNDPGKFCIDAFGTFCPIYD